MPVTFERLRSTDGGGHVLRTLTGQRGLRAASTGGWVLLKDPLSSARGVRAVLAVALLCLFTLVPATAAQAGPERRGSITIGSNDEFSAENGVRSGSGTAADPYVISGWELPSLTIHDTDAYVVIRDNVISNRLTLNWIGDRATVVDNVIGDLRVNENVKRTGEATSGLITRNRLGLVGQLRHFDGVFRHNVVDVRSGSICCRLPVFGSGAIRAVNFDGFNGARFTRNEIYGGYVEVRLHGHHHSSGFGDHSHYHGAAAEGHAMDHTQRYHEVWVTNNKIEAPPGYYGLIYTDNGHAANDRTAASERNEELNKPHIHYTRVHLTGNQLIGSGLYVDVFNADDQRHTGTSRGVVDVVGNEIRLLPPGGDEIFTEVAGIEVFNARDVDLTIARNRVFGPEDDRRLFAEWRSEPGIKLQLVELGRIWLRDNFVAHRAVGIEAVSFKDVKWWISGLRTRAVEQEVSYDGSSEPPRRDP